MSDAFQAHLAELRARFRGRLGRKLEDLRALRDRPEAGPELRALAHGIAGSAGTFGFHELGERAFALEAAVERGEQEGARAALDALVREIEGLPEA